MLFLVTCALSYGCAVGLCSSLFLTYLDGKNSVCKAVGWASGIGLIVFLAISCALERMGGAL